MHACLPRTTLPMDLSSYGLSFNGSPASPLSSSSSSAAVALQWPAHHHASIDDTHPIASHSPNCYGDPVIAPNMPKTSAFSQPTGLHSLNDDYLGCEDIVMECISSPVHSRSVGLPKRRKPAHPVSPSSTLKLPITPSPVPKLGDRITALQQLVSPFGKTDTASVLLEAIGYIKFLQEQVQVLSSPYMMPALSRKISGEVHSTNHGGESKRDLRSKGLCLVPISCTLNVLNNDNGADYWTSVANNATL